MVLGILAAFLLMGPGVAYRPLNGHELVHLGYLSEIGHGRVLNVDTRVNYGPLLGYTLYGFMKAVGFSLVGFRLYWNAAAALGLALLLHMSRPRFRSRTPWILLGVYLAVAAPFLLRGTLLRFLEASAGSVGLVARGAANLPYPGVLDPHRSGVGTVCVYYLLPALLLLAVTVEWGRRVLRGERDDPEAIGMIRSLAEGEPTYIRGNKASLYYFLADVPAAAPFTDLSSQCVTPDEYRLLFSTLAEHPPATVFLMEQSIGPHPRRENGYRFLGSRHGLEVYRRVDLPPPAAWNGDAR